MKIRQMIAELKMFFRGKINGKRTTAKNYCSEVLKIDVNTPYNFS